MSAKKRASNTEVRGLLLEGHFGQSPDLGPADPITPTHMHLDIDRIKPYEHNPRRLQNPMYAQIRASILKKQGLDDPISITRRPGEDRYTVRAGGNTRLSILKDLLRETENPAFSRATCLFVPWTSESDCITAHLIENELRGELAFIDKAVALKQLLQQVEEESGESLSRSEFARRLAEIGYPISRRQMIRYEYTADVLEPLIPEALDAGLGGRHIDQIKDAEKHYSEYWKSCGLDAKAFDPVFRSTLSDHDSDGWNSRLALDDLEMRISEKAGKSINTVRLEVDEWIAGVKPKSLPSHPERTVTSPQSTDSGDPDPHSDGSDVTVTVLGVDPDHGATPDGTDRQDIDSAGVEDQEQKVSETEPLDQGEVDFQDDEEPTSSFLSSELNTAREKQPADTDLKSLRSRARVLATRFAQSLDCQHVIHPSTQGYGFFVDSSDPPLRDHSDVAWWGWWLLFALSEQAITQARLELAPSGMRLPKLLIDDRLDEAFALSSHPLDAIQNLSHVFLSSPQLSERAFKDLLMLIETCRTLRNQFPENTLWHCPIIDQLYKGDQP